MKGDFSRDTFNPTKHFLRVLMQQGRVQLDADWNEQVAIFFHYLQNLATDLIGPHGGPINNCSFEIKLDTSIPDFTIGEGHYYVDGILCELEATPVPIIGFPANTTNQAQLSNLIIDDRALIQGQWIEIFTSSKNQLLKITEVDINERILTFHVDILAALKNSSSLLRRKTIYYAQPDYPLDPNRNPLPQVSYLVYLDVWERHITNIEDFKFPFISEIALQGKDTTTRAKVIWQVKATSEIPSGVNLTRKNVINSWDKWVQLWQPVNRGLMKAKGKETLAKDVSPCTISPTAPYRGAENQLYRVEIHKSGAAGTATFKWSRDNGALIFPIMKIEGNAITIEHLGLDDRQSLEIGNWVEIIDDDYALQDPLRGQERSLLQIEDIDLVEKIVKLPEGTVLPSFVKEKHFYLRRWESKDVVIEEKNDDPQWFDLEDGIRIQFQRGDHIYRSNDYWLIPARTATGDILWPTETDGSGNELPRAQEPHGLIHHYAPIWIINVSSDGNVSADAENDCRCKFKSISECPEDYYSRTTDKINATNLITDKTKSKVKKHDK